jgi:hypothetical protein
VCHRIDQERNLKLFGHSLERFGLSVTLAHACCVQSIYDFIRRCFAADAVGRSSCSVKGAKFKYLIFHLIAPASTPFWNDSPTCRL